MEYNNYLTHHGVKGMKWGVRRNRRKSANVHEDYSRAHSKKRVEEMSDKELRERNNRLQMERQYNELNKKKVSKGRKWATGVVVAAATTVATGYATTYMKKGMDYVIDQMSK